MGVSRNQHKGGCEAQCECIAVIIQYIWKERHFSTQYTEHCTGSVGYIIIYLHCVALSLNNNNNIYMHINPAQVGPNPDMRPQHDVYASIKAAASSRYYLHWANPSHPTPCMWIWRCVSNNHIIIHTSGLTKRPLHVNQSWSWRPTNCKTFYLLRYFI